jgi:starch phosphorylase
VQDIPAAELWAARCGARAQLVDMIARRATSDRLRRGEPLDYAEAAGSGLDPERLTIGFARRLATYKRLHLVALLPRRAGADRRRATSALCLLAKSIRRSRRWRWCQVFASRSPSAAGRAAFGRLRLTLAAQLRRAATSGSICPGRRRASGTSGMKSCLGGGLQLSVLDGWWAEAFDGSNGWAINGDVDDNHEAQDQRDARALFDLLEQEVVPMFHERDAQGVPPRWVAMMRRSLLTNGPRFSATRMVREYADQVYRRD